MLLRNVADDRAFFTPVCLNTHVNEKLTIGFFLLGCVIVTATIMAVNRIERLEDIIVKQQDTIEQQEKAIAMQRLETQMLRMGFGR